VDAPAQADAPPVCVTPADCDDHNACTTDGCNADTGCTHAALSCDDHDACTTDGCDPASGCTHAPVGGHGMQTLDFTGGMQAFVVPTCVTLLHVTAAGAQGGTSTAAVGGLGATLSGDFIVVPGDMLNVLVGGQGLAATDTRAQRGGAGGGGSFVLIGANILVIAGGGGGAHGGDFGQAPGGPGQTATAGQIGGAPTPTNQEGNKPGGTNGGGGTSMINATGYQGGTGGGGYSGDGVGVTQGDAQFGTPNNPGKAYVNGGAGGIGGSAGRSGGYGGGGAAGFTGGGGGGYSGGGAGASISTGTQDHSGGGGGSINNGTNQNNAAGNRAGNGQVVITW
jgi:hypothetical protein